MIYNLCISSDNINIYLNRFNKNKDYYIIQVNFTIIADIDRDGTNTIIYIMIHSNELHLLYQDLNNVWI